MILLAAALVSACSSSLTGPQTGIEGQWRWVKSEGGLLPADRTPATEGYALTLVFESSGIVRLLQDGLPSGETTFQVTIGSPGAHEGVPVIRYGEPLLGFAEQGYQFVAPDSLVLQDGCCDGFTYHFVREAGS
jgi:hypothetical protein